MIYGVGVNWDTLVNYQWQIDWDKFILAFCFFPLGVLPTVYAWHLLVTGLGVSRPFRNNVIIFALSSLPRRLPGVIWYVGSRALWYQEQGIPATVVILATAWETLSLGTSGLLVYSVTTLAKGSDFLLTWTLLVVLLVVITLAICCSCPFFLRKLLIKLKKKQCLHDVQFIHPVRILVILAVYVFAWGSGGVFFYFLVTSVCGPMPFWPLVSIWAAAGATGVLASVIQGLGLKELTMSVLLSNLLPLPIAVAISVLIRVVHTVAETLLLLSMTFFLTIWTKRTE